MSAITAEDAFQAYETVRHRLPDVPSRDKTYRTAKTLEELAEHFDVFLLDAFGVLNIGETAISGAPERVKQLQAAGKRVIVVSNAAGFPKAALKEKYARLGYDFASEDIVTSRATMLAGLKENHSFHWCLMATRSSGLSDLEDLTLSYLEEESTVYETVDGILMIGSASWTDDLQTLLEEALLMRPRPVLVGNPDIAAPREQGFSAEPGYFAHRLADRTGIAPVFFGKPFANIFDLAFERIGPVDKSRVLMVGNSLHTDILGARAWGVASALISGFGFFAGQDVSGAIAQSGIAPDYIVARP